MPLNHHPPPPHQNNKQNAYISVTDRRPPPTPTPHHPLFHHTTTSFHYNHHISTSPYHSLRLQAPHRPSQSHSNQPRHPIFTDFSIVSPTLSSHPASQPANQSPSPLVPSTLPRNPHNVPWPLLNPCRPERPTITQLRGPKQSQNNYRLGFVWIFLGDFSWSCPFIDWLIE